MKFLKTLLACLLAIFISSVIGIIVIVAIVSPGESQYVSKPNTVLKLELKGEIVETSEIDLNGSLQKALKGEDQPLVLGDIINAILEAKSDDNIKGIYLTTDGYLGSYVASTEIVRNLKAFKETGKFIVAYNDFCSQNQYFINSVADEVYINPIGAVDISGLTSKHFFIAKTLEKFGIKAQIFKVGTFKSAVEPLILTKMSKENREQTETYLNSMWGFIAQEIGGRRNLSVEKINEFADMGIGYSKTETLYELGLVDGLKYKSEVLEIIKNKLDVKEVEFTTIDELSTVKQKESKRKDVVAVLYAEGQIVDKKAPGSIYPSAMLKEIEMLKKDDDVKAVVLRVNSPGGSAFASEQIWHAIEELKAVKPVVVSMGTYAASGGYYISCGANFIVAEATTLTGSIGVFGIIPDFQGLATDKLGVTLDEVKTNKFGMITILEPVTKEEGVMIQRGVENFYELFLKRCSEGRNIPLDEMAKIAEGRVWSGLNAKEIGLVDAIGGVYESSCKAAELAGLNSFKYEAYPKKKSLMEAILAELDTKATISMKQLMLGESYSTLQLKEYLESRKGIQARMDDIIIK